mmetsp:Transcript_30616/g.59012  ORF Transcript_30616/g.59012 Transcript_30616/m.59012 type:complete len:260 (-) Transcript_30616:130-909(-)|eukprot:CAMPEP_0114250360 /NCGR_PEP_ID=MMETSP0058-20121206/14656_1 /TAXON_ID=36894 /ORGANISM="Pyramimonas parkeae, CCMP726" /LENGTH=259 /DNA_ID=CAMNT_0001364011 /DNA_START=377 /DNA_END=1156 /DNA_ORIENTATION=-
MADAIKPLAGGGSRAASALSPLRPFSALSWSGLEDAMNAGVVCSSGSTLTTDLGADVEVDDDLGAEGAATGVGVGIGAGVGVALGSTGLASLLATSDDVMPAIKSATVGAGVGLSAGGSLRWPASETAIDNRCAAPPCCLFPGASMDGLGSCCVSSDSAAGPPPAPPSFPSRSDAGLAWYVADRLVSDSGADGGGLGFSSKVSRAGLITACAAPDVSAATPSSSSRSGAIDTAAIHALRYCSGLSIPSSRCRLSRDSFF